MQAHGSQRSMLAWCLLAQLCTTTSALRSRRFTHVDVKADSYSFDAFVKDFGKNYKQGTTEYLQRHTIFNESMTQILAINSRVGRSWSAGAHLFMDWTAEEHQGLRGYQFSQTRRAAPFAAMQLSTRVYGGLGDTVVVPTPDVRQQGVCGSCWAMAATEAVESQLMKHGIDARPSVEALLECVDNAQHCGGRGGCGGATAELAFDYMAGSGVPTEKNLAYKPLTASTCRISETSYPADWSRVYINGFQSLPSNQAQPLMQALVEQGPVVITADASDWTHYKHGIFDSCSKDAVIDHSVLAKGYGESGGQKFWLIQNSWGESWGEHGLLRLLRHDDEDGWCGTDSRPQEGAACDGQTEPIKVCGSCGLLFDPVFPYGARVEGPKQEVADASQADAVQADAPQTAAPQADAPEADADAYQADVPQAFAPQENLPTYRMKHVEKKTDTGDKAEDYYANFAKTDPATQAQQNSFLRSAIAQDSESYVDPQAEFHSQSVDSPSNSHKDASDRAAKLHILSNSDDDTSDMAGDIPNGSQDPHAWEEDEKLINGTN